MPYLRQIRSTESASNKYNFNLEMYDTFMQDSGERKEGPEGIGGEDSPDPARKNQKLSSVIHRQIFNNFEQMGGASRNIMKNGRLQPAKEEPSEESKESLEVIQANLPLPKKRSTRTQGLEENKLEPIKEESPQEHHKGNLNIFLVSHQLKIHPLSQGLY